MIRRLRVLWNDRVTTAGLAGVLHFLALGLLLGAALGRFWGVVLALGVGAVGLVLEARWRYLRLDKRCQPGAYDRHKRQ